MSFLFKNKENLYISCILDTKWKDSNTDFVLGNCLLGDVKLTKKFDSNKYRCSGYSIGFDSSSYFLWKDGSPSKNVIMLSADRS